MLSARRASSLLVTLPMIHIDFESRSQLDLKKVGVCRYAEHPSTEVLCMGYAFDDEPVQIWNAFGKEPFPWRVLEATRGDKLFAAWNANFERVIWNVVFRRQLMYADMQLKNEQWWCIMADAAAMGLPLGLDMAARAMLHGESKDKQGEKVMTRLSKPKNKKTTEFHVPTPEELDALHHYCAQDVELERAIARKVRRLPEFERKVWLVDAAMNDRGITVDLPLVESALLLSAEAGRIAEKELTEVTHGEITSATQHARFTKYFQREVDPKILSSDKEAMQSLLERVDLALHVRRVAELRVEFAKSSAAKLETMRIAASVADDRIRGMLQYGAAHTLRWGGRLVQPQNFPRGEIPNIHDYLSDILNVEYDEIDVFYPVRHVLSSALRAMLIAAPGKLFCAYDYGAIEVRVLAWLAGQDDALERYRRNEDQYIAMAAYIFGIPESEVKKGFHRNLGKNCVLGCGFGMGWKRFKIASAKAPYFMDVSEELAKLAVDGYRTLWDKVPVFWRAVENMVIDAVRSLRAKQVCGKVSAIANHEWLMIRLPSGRSIHYRKPMLDMRETPWGVDQECVSVVVVDDKTRQFTRNKLWGGLITENIVQAVARDLIADAMVKAHDRGVDLLLTVHDELVAEAPAAQIAELSATLSDCMLSTPAWAHGLPIAVEGWTGERYRK